MIDNDTRRELDQLKQGTTFTGGTFSLVSSPSTSTTVTRTSISASSVIHPQAYGSTAANADITRIIPFSGGFTVYHTSSTAARDFRYTFSTPR